jgi:hypothetical protein
MNEAARGCPRPSAERRKTADFCGDEAFSWRGEPSAKATKKSWKPGIPNRSGTFRGNRLSLIWAA